MANRIKDKVAKFEDCLTRGVRVDNGQPTDPQAVATMDTETVFDFEEFVKFNNLNVAAHLKGLTTDEESQYIYDTLGEGGPDKINKASLATRLVFTQILGELLNLRIKGKI